MKNMAMKTRPLGKTELDASEFCMSCWQIGDLSQGPVYVKNVRPLLSAAYYASVNAYELTDVYDRCSAPNRAHSLLRNPLVVRVCH